MKLFFFISIALSLFPMDVFAVCDQYLPAISDSKVESGEMKEISGLVASRQNPGIYWVHNDSGSGPFIYAVDTQGKYIAKIHVKEIGVNDVEDISIGKCEASEHCLYLADIGNNKGNRNKLQILTVPEPKIDLKKGFKTFEMDPQRTYFHYPEWRKYDAEAMAYNYKDDYTYIIRKDGGQKHSLFRFKQSPFYDMKAQYVCDLKNLKNYHVVTAMDIHRSDNAMVVRTYKPDNPWQDSALYEYRYTKIDDVCDIQPTKLEHGQEGQGEAVSYRYHKPGIVHVSEGYAPKIFNLDCSK